MQRMILLVSLIVFAGFAVTAEETDQQVAEEIIAITKAQWAAEKEKNLVEAMKNVAEEYTEFNPNSPVRVDGRRWPPKSKRSSPPETPHRFWPRWPMRRSRCMGTSLS